MSIRLRLTLVYTAILALTLASLGAILYSTQLQSMRSGEERLLAAMAQRVVELVRLGGTAECHERGGEGQGHDETTAIHDYSAPRCSAPAVNHAW